MKKANEISIDTKEKKSLRLQDREIVHGFVLSVLSLYPQQKSLLSENDLKQMMRIYADKIISYTPEQRHKLLDFCRDLSGVHKDYKFAANALARLMTRFEIVSHDHREWFPPLPKEYDHQLFIEQKAQASSKEFALDQVKILKKSLQ